MEARGGGGGGGVGGGGRGLRTNSDIRKGETLLLNVHVRRREGLLGTGTSGTQYAADSRHNNRLLKRKRKEKKAVSVRHCAAITYQQIVT